MFYEKQEVIVDFLTQGGQLQYLPGYQQIVEFLQKPDVFDKQSSFESIFERKDKMGDPLCSPEIRKILQSFYENIHKFPQSFYFTEEGQQVTNFWTGRQMNKNQNKYWMWNK